MSASVSCVKNRFAPNTLSRGTVATTQSRHLKKTKQIKANKLRPCLSPVSARMHAERSGEMHYERHVKSSFLQFFAARADRDVSPQPTVMPRLCQRWRRRCQEFREPFFGGLQRRNLATLSPGVLCSGDNFPCSS